MLGEKRAHTWGPKGYNKWGFIRLLDSHKQGSPVLRFRPLLFNVFANDLHVVLEDVLSKFCDDRKVGGTEASTEGGEDLQRDVDKLENWASSNHMKYNKNKGLILHLGRHNPGHTDCLGDGTLEISATERGWGSWSTANWA